MINSEEVVKAKISQWIKLNFSDDQIRENLKADAVNESDIEQYLNLYQKAKDSQRMNIGFVLTGSGSFMGFISCIASMLITHPHWNSIFLYGGTSLSVVIALYGLYLVFEK